MDKVKVEANIAVGSRGNPTVTNAFLNLAEVCTSTLVQHAAQLGVAFMSRIDNCLKQWLTASGPQS